jgi:hypothetical protein
MTKMNSVGLETEGKEKASHGDWCGVSGATRGHGEVMGWATRLASPM